MKRVRPSVLPSLLLPWLLAGCGSLATTPSWVGGGMVVTGPMRVSLDDEEEPEATTSATTSREGEPDEIAARHILVMHDDSQAKPDEVARTREEALARAKACLLELRSGADFTDMVKKYSDEPGAVERGGDLGVFRREVMVKAFADAAFSLSVGEVSEVVETEYGFHVIKRTR